jgi:hypothetical protein
VTRTLSTVLSAAVLLSTAACGSSAPTQPPGVPPRPQTVTVAEPGGDAHDPHVAALSRALAQPWGQRDDKDGQIFVPLPDWEKWKRVRYWGVEHLVGFRYGDEHHAVALIFVRDVEPGADLDSKSCLRDFEAWARPQTQGYDVKLQPIETRTSKWRGQRLYIHFVDGHADYGFSRKKFSAAWAAYPAYPDACLIYAIGVPWRDHADEAKKLRDRFLTEAFERVNPLTQTRPERK